MAMPSPVTFFHLAFFSQSYRLFCVCMILIKSMKEGSAQVTPSSRNVADRFALLAFKSQVLDPLGALNSWNDSVHHCDWKGIRCSLQDRDRVASLDLESQKLEGTLSPYIGNLTFLTNLTLSQNNFRGEIPQEIGRLSRLQQLSLSNNSFDGGIPVNITRCSDLRLLNLIDNKLSGNISAELGSLLKLEGLGLALNDLSGYIPPSLGNISTLGRLSLSRNNLLGSIPDDLCRCRNLSFFQVASNGFTGKVPSCLYNLSNLVLFSVVQNQLEGSLPPNIGLTLPSIQQIYWGINNFTGLIPVSLSNATTLEDIALYQNGFTGPVPSDLGKLKSLRSLFLQENQLGSEGGNDLEFVTSLTNCSHLERVQFDKNLLRGPLPESMSNLSRNLTYFDAGDNQIYGSIPVGIENLLNIQRLYLFDNYLTGTIPAVIGKLGKLQKIYLQGNKFSGQIPASLGKLSELTELQLGDNNFSGSIPPSLAMCQNLALLNLSHNNLNGTIPKEVIGMSSLTMSLNLDQNALTGSLPSEVGKLTDLVMLTVSGNRLSGDIPGSLGSCLTLATLYMDNNFFQGRIPKSLSSLRGLEYFDLSHNNLSGEIPEYLKRFSLLKLNLSFNQFEGQVPDDGVFGNTSLFSLGGNKNLCGGIADLNLPPCTQNSQKTKKKSFPIKVVVPVIVGSVCFLLLLCFVLQRRMPQKQKSPSTLPSEQPKRLTYAELLRATNGFSSENLIGVGSYGSVFKGSLEEFDKVVAVKVLNLPRKGASASFLTECNAMRKLHHRNLLRIITSCSSMDFQGNDFKALVFEYMPNKSLEELLHPRADRKQLELRNLNFTQCLTIAIDVASALEYLHHYFRFTIVHCDLKPSNVLLNDDMTARVADFGIAKIYSATLHDSAQNLASTVVLKGSIGYVAPEYGMGGPVSTQGDVYSYGILLLEIFTRRKPTDDMFVDGLSLHEYAKMALPNQVVEIVDPNVLVEENDKLLDIADAISERLMECLTSTIRLGVTCSAESPVERMNMKEVVRELQRIRDHHQGVEPLSDKLASVKFT